MAAAAVLPPGEYYPGLTDSKLLQPAARDRWFSHIRKVALDYAIAIVSETDIDHFNILVASRKAMEMAVAGLSRQPDYLLIDGIVPLETAIAQQCLKKGDRRSQSIAAASILAKVTRDRIMEQMHEHYPQYNFKRNKGYGTKEHCLALERHGCTPLHRRSFRTVRAVLTDDTDQSAIEPGEETGLLLTSPGTEKPRAR